MMKISLLGMNIVAVIFLSLPSFASARLETAQAHPKVSKPAISTHLALAFSERLNLKATFVEIRNSRGSLMEIGELRTAANGTDLEIPLSAPLRPDIYTIRWRVVSISGIVDEGGYGFQVEPSFSGKPALAGQ
jgi:methionine-rich copper-binding protein CopC